MLNAKEAIAILCGMVTSTWSRRNLGQ